MDQNLGPFEFFEKFDGYFLLKLYYNKNFYYLLVFVQKSHIWEKILCRDISQNVISQLQNFLINHISKKINEIA